MTATSPSRLRLGEALAAIGLAVLWLALLGPVWVQLAGAAGASGLVASGLVLSRRRSRADATARREAEMALAALADEAGAAAAANADAVEVVKRRLGELGAEAATLAAILDAIEEPVLAVDGEGVVQAANRGAAAMLAPGSGVGLVGRPLDQLLPDEAALTVVRRALRGEASRAQTRLLTGDGPRIVEVSGEPVGGGSTPDGGPAVVAILRDVTEQATAMQLKTDFVANASHELRTPLASIKTAAETLADLGDESPDMRARLVSMISSNAERLEELSRDLLDLSRLESAEAECARERVDVLELVRDLRELFEPACTQRGIGLEFEINDRLAELWTDGRLLRLVLRNLIDNAVKFAYEGTTVRVRATAVSSGPGAAADARFEIIDRGIGIPLAQQQRIFERFFQVDAARSGSPRRRGTGLGLAIVKHALRAMGGAIHVKSVWQQGTTMTVELPGAAAASSLTA